MKRSFTSFVAVIAMLGGLVGTSHADTVLYATDYSGNSLKKMDGTTGSYASGWTAPGIGQPVGVGVDGAGNVYAVSQTTSSLYKYDSSGTLVGGYSVTGLSGPQGLAIAGDGTAYVANAISGLISVYGPSGSLITSNLVGSAIGNPYGLALDGLGNLYIAAQSTGIISKVNATTGAAAAQWTNVTGFNSPTGLALDASGNLYVSSFAGGYISKYDSHGSSMTYTSPQYGGSYLPGPQGIAIDGNALYVALNYEVLKYDLTTSVKDAGFTAPTFDAVMLATYTPSSVPEIDPASMGSVLAMVVGALGAIERRFLRSRLAGV